MRAIQHAGAQTMDAPAKTDALCEDDGLLRAVAEHRDHEAFCELYRRYEHLAYNLARHLTGDAHHAAEAVQEAMLRVWIRASTFRPDGSARGWILRIVAHESLRNARRLNAAKVEEDHTMLARATHRSDPLEKEEQIATLRRSLESLPSPYRQVVALHFGAGLTQGEIGAELKVSTKTVANRLGEALRRLRVLMAQAGVASAAPLLGADALAGAIAGGAVPPAHLEKAVLARLADPASQAAEISQRISRRAAAAKGGGWLWMTGMALMTAAAAAGWWALSDPAPAAVEPSAAPPIAETPAAPQPPAKFEAVTWTFENGPPPGMKLLKGEWKWLPTPPFHGPCMMPGQTDETAAIVRLPLEIPSRPTVIRCKIWMPREGDWSFGAYLHKEGDFTASPVASLSARYGEPIHPHKIWSKFQALLFRKKEDMVRLRLGEIYCLGRYMIGCIEGKPFVVREYDRPYPSKDLSLVLKTWNVTEISIHPLEEIPPHLSNVEAVIQGLGVSKIQVDEQGRKIEPSTPAASGADRNAAKTE